MVSTGPLELVVNVETDDQPLVTDPQTLCTRYSYVVEEARPETETLFVPEVVLIQLVVPFSL
jgi:hypothetical protein